MEPAVRFMVLIDDEINKLTFNSGMPSSVDELLAAIKETFSIKTEISLQYKDDDFNDFFTLTSTSDLKDKDTLKIVYAPPSITLSFVPLESSSDTADVSSLSESLNHSVDSDDTVILSPLPVKGGNHGLLCFQFLLFPATLSWL